jgi:hypothetical protein
MDNANSFLQSGGVGAWFFIPFFHNEHQVEDAEELAKEMGFQEFAIKISARWNDYRKPFIYDGGKLYPPTADRFNIESEQKSGNLICVSEYRKEIYVDAWGKLWPCCWTASRSKKENWNLQNSLYEMNLREILDHPDYNKWINELYSCNNSICHQRCTGSKIHIIEIDGEKTPQKNMWMNYGEV